MKSVLIQTIPHAEQRYDTCGDWWWSGDHLDVRVSDTGNWRANMCVAVHELHEALLCFDRGITEKDVTAFDKGAGAKLDEPGDSPKAPYWREHLSAYVPEYALLSGFGLPVSQYTRLLEDLE